jgi:metacaspase-1
MKGVDEMAKGIAINIGLNSVDPDHYDGWDGQLNACEADAEDMRRIAKSQGFETQAFLLTKDATADAVRQAIQGAAQELAEGDLLFLTYSGHGGQVPDTNSDEPDARDETWVLYDRQLVDDELYAMWAGFEPGVRIFALSDSCHSGTVTRAIYEETLIPMTVERGFAEGSSVRTKDLPLHVQAETYRQHQDQYDEIQRTNPRAEQVDIAAGVILISGCQDNQLSLDGDRNGLFTSKLLKVWKNGDFKGGHRRFRRSIANLMPPSQTPNFYPAGEVRRSFVRQRPLTI